MQEFITQATVGLLAVLVAVFGDASEWEPVIITSDVNRIYEVLAAANGRPLPQYFDTDYLAKGSPGLQTFAKEKRITGASLWASAPLVEASRLDWRRCTPRTF